MGENRHGNLGTHSRDGDGEKPLLWAWEADAEYDEQAGEQWMVLHPDKYNRQVQYAWRFDPCELVAPGQQKTCPRPPTVEDAVTDDDFYE